MALIKCPECGNDISDKAKRCPKCGFKPHKNRKDKLCLIIGTVILMSILLFAFWVWALVSARYNVNASFKILFGNWGCLTRHDWEEATCEHKKTCKQCGTTEGGYADHVWKEATCSIPKTCSVCGEQEGKPVEHTWEEATCTTPKTCSVCGKQEGGLKEHVWEKATCVKLKTCMVCGTKEGDYADHDWEEATCTTPMTCKVCHQTKGSAKGHTTRIGKCATCGKQVYELNSEATSIMKDVTTATNNITDGLSYATQSADSYFGYYCNFSVTAVNFSFAKTELQSAIKTCGSYEEFAEIKKILSDWEKAIPGDCKDSSSKEVKRYYNDLKVFLEASQEYSEAIHEIIASWGYNV